MLRQITRLTLLLLVAAAVAIGGVTAQSNLLNDPGFEGDYTGRGRPDFNIPSAWGGWYTETPRTESWMNVPPLAFPHTASFKREGGKSLHIARGSGTFTASVFQIVPNIQPGTVLRASVWVYIENNPSSGSQVRLGLGNNVGGDPFAPGIVWSNWATNANAWNNLSVDLTADGGEVTFFVYATQNWPNDPNGVYVDEASLVVIGAGEVQPTAASGGAPVQPTPVVAPPVQAQGQRDDGSIVHIVQPGDTLAAIAVAYGVKVSDLLTLNNMADASLLRIGQEILVRPPSTDTPEPEPQTVAAAASPTPRPTQPPLQITPGGILPTLPPLEGEQSAPAAQPTATAMPPTATPLPSVTPVQEQQTTLPSVTPIPTEPTEEATTEVMPAPVVTVTEENIPAVQDPDTVNGVLCISQFEDVNQNRIHEEGEAYLAGGSYALQQNAETIQTANFDDAAPICIDDLPAGTYRVLGRTPDGYGMTTATSYNVQIEAGERVDVWFGMLEGLEMPTVPPETTEEPMAEATAEPADTSVMGDLTNLSGLLVLAAAGLTLIGGMTLSFLLRSR